MTTHRCLVVEFEVPPDLRQAVSAAIGRLPEIDAETTQAVGRTTESPDAVILLSSQCGAERLVEFAVDVRSRFPASALIVVGEALNPEQFGSLLAAGVSDFTSASRVEAELGTRLRRALGILGTGSASIARGERHPRLRGFIGNASAFAREVDKLPTFAACDAGVLVHGETGTGKELFAQAIHYLSPRASRPWVAVNCGAIPTDLVENELFGHVRGAYTTASTSRDGLVQEADGGTLFLDDVDCLPLAAQAKLLRFLQEREYRAVGSNTLRHADVRVIAASNHQLAAMAARGEFRLDLYFRLNVLPLTLPPLRERSEDIAALAQHFVGRFAREFGRPVAGLAPTALRRLLAHRWPGNVRELQHVIERAVLLARGTSLTDADIDVGAPAPRDLACESLRAAKAKLIEDFERSFIERLLSEHGGNVTHAADAAGKNRRSFFELIRRYRIEPAQFRPQR